MNDRAVLEEAKNVATEKLTALMKEGFTKKSDLHEAKLYNSVIGRYFQAKTSDLQQGRFVVSTVNRMTDGDPAQMAACVKKMASLGFPPLSITEGAAT